jgi:hypothetical protein
MKSKLLFSMLLLFCAISGIAQNKMQLVGTWKLVSGKVTIGDSTYPYDSKTVDAIKIVTPTHFAVISKNVTNDSMQHAVAGTVKMDEKNYTEEIQYVSDPAMIGKKAKFTYRIEGDKWYAKGGIENMMMFDEVWQRLK